MDGGSITTIPFAGSELVAIRGTTPEATFVAMRPVVEAMGLDWPTQHRKLSSHPVLGPCMVNSPMQVGGQTREMACLPLTRVNYWLATIQTNKLATRLREKVLTYQRECADVLFAHFFGRVDSPIATTPTKGELARMIAAINDDKLADHLLPIHAGMAELAAKLDDLAAGRVADPAATPTKDYMTTLTYLEGKACPSKGRRAVVNAVSARLMKHSERHGFPIRTTAERGIRLFHLDAWKSWEDSGGRAFLSALRDQRDGQGRLRLDHGRKATAR